MIDNRFTRQDVKSSRSVARFCCGVFAAIGILVAVSTPALADSLAPNVPILGSDRLMMLMLPPIPGVSKGGTDWGMGWGTYKPREVFNGGDPSGDVSAISWKGWGKPIAYGFGKNPIFKPGGGYYPLPVVIELRVSNLGHCMPGGPLAYRRLATREPSQPGGKLGPWISWGGRNICGFGS